MLQFFFVTHRMSRMSIHRMSKIFEKKNTKKIIKERKIPRRYGTCEFDEKGRRFTATPRNLQKKCS